MIKERLFKEQVLLEDKTLVVKAIGHEDLEEFYELCHQEALFKYKPGRPKKNKKTVANMIEHYGRDFKKQKMIYQGIYLKGPKLQLIGLGEIFDFDKQVLGLTFGYTINEQHWGKGHGKAYTQLIKNYLFETVGIKRLQAFVMVENIRSHRVLQHCNFTKEGLIRQGYYWKDKGIVDLVVYSYLYEDWLKDNANGRLCE